MSLYLLNWTETQAKKQPSPSEVFHWLKSQGFSPEGLPKVYPNGTVQVEVPGTGASSEGLLEEVWASFQPLPAVPQEDQLALHIQTLLQERKKLLAIPEHKRTPTESALLATMALVMYGYGVVDG